MAQKNNDQMEDILETFEALDNRYRNESKETRIRMMLLLAGDGKVIVGC
ncbi:MAG: hypothetical protein JWQ98_414 [Chlorobi bacterium]|nr:hypothetical protein [Chlorobiota bacterium]